MAGTPDKAPDSSSGSGADALTPPTMKFASSSMQSSSADEHTIKVSPNTVAGANKTMPTRSTMASKSVSEATSDDNQALSAGIETQDLLNDPLLLAAPRVDFRGKQAPCLNGIPMLAMIGRGGMGAVYYGVHPRLRSEVAVKVLPFHLAEQDQGMVRRFFREAQIAAQVRSPHLVNVMDVNEEAGLFFLVMEFVPGRTAGQVLKHYMEKGQPVSEKDTLDVIIAATEGLWAAHSANVVHRDIKPENIMVPYVGRGSKDFDLRRAKLMDLGLARNEDSNQSLTGAQAAMGTPGYMAPEQAMDAKTADKRSDVFSMGATIYCMLNGKAPFRGETVMKILMATMHEPHEPIIKLRPDVSPMLNEIVERCLAKKQEHRFKDAKELLSALEDCKRLGAGGMSGALPTPGTFNYLPPTTSNTPAPGSGTNVTQMGLPDAAAVGAKKGGKGMLLIGGGVAAALLAGGAFFAFSGPGKPKIDPARKELLVKRFDTDMGEAEKLITGKDPASQLSLLRAYHAELRDSDLVKVEETYKKRVEDLDKKIAGLAARADLEKKVAALNSLLLSEKVDEFKKLLPEAEALALDDFGKKLIEPLRKNGIDLSALLASKKSFVESVGKTRKALSEKNLEASKAEFAAAQKLVPETPTTEAQKKFATDAKADLAALQRELKALEGEAETAGKIKELTAKIADRETAKDFKAAHDLAVELQLLDPRNQEIGKKIDAFSKQLGAEEQAKKEKEKTDRIAKIFAEATEFQKKGDLDEAEQSLRRLLAFDENHAGGKSKLSEVQKAIADRDAKAALDRKRRTVDESLSSVTLLLNNNGDMEVALQKLDAARKEIPDDPEYLGKIDVALALVNERREQQKLIKDADALLDKAAPFSLETEMPKLKEGQELVLKALQKAPKHARAIELAATFQRKIDEQLKFQAQNKEAYDKLMAGAEKRLASAEGKSLPEQLSILELAKSDFDDAKKMQPAGTAAKKVDEIAARLVTIKEQIAKQRKIDGIVTGADGLAARGSFDDAIKALADLQQLDAATYAKKSEDYKARKTQAEQLIVKQLQSIATKASQGSLSSALADARALRDANVARTDLNTIVSALDAASRADAEVQNDAAALRGRVDRHAQFLKDLGAAEKGNALAQIQAYQGIVAAKAKELADGGFKNAELFAQTLRDARSTPKYNADNAVSRYEAVARPSSSGSVGEGNIDDGPRKPQPKPDKPKPEKRKGSVGEGNIDD